MWRGPGQTRWQTPERPARGPSVAAFDRGRNARRRAAKGARSRAGGAKPERSAGPRNLPPRWPAEQTGTQNPERPERRTPATPRRARERRTRARTAAGRRQAAGGGRERAGANAKRSRPHERGRPSAPPPPRAAKAPRHFRRARRRATPPEPREGKGLGGGTNNDPNAGRQALIAPTRAQRRGPEKPPQFPPREINFRSGTRSGQEGVKGVRGMGGRARENNASRVGRTTSRGCSSPYSTIPLTMGPPAGDCPLTAAIPTGAADSHAIANRPIVKGLSRHNGTYDKAPLGVEGGYKMFLYYQVV